MTARLLIAAFVVASIGCLDARFGADDGCYVGDECGAVAADDAGSDVTDAGAGGGDAGGGTGGGAGGGTGGGTGGGGGGGAGGGAGADAGCQDVALNPPVFPAAVRLALSQTNVNEEGAGYSVGVERLCYFDDSIGAPGIYCRPLGATGGFGAAIVQTFINSTTEPVSNPTLSHDGEEMVYTQGNPGRLMYARYHQARGYGFNVKQRILPTIIGARSPELSADGAELYFSLETTPDAGVLHVAERLLDGGFGNERPVENVNVDGGYNDSPTLSPDGRWMIFQSGPREPNAQLYISQRICGVWSASQRLFITGPSANGLHPEWMTGTTLLLDYKESGSATKHDLHFTYSGN